MTARDPEICSDGKSGHFYGRQDQRGMLRCIDCGQEVDIKVSEMDPGSLVRTRSEILAAVKDLREMAAYGELFDSRGPVITQFDAMKKVAEALEWAVGVDSDFAELLALLKALEQGKSQ